MGREIKFRAWDKRTKQMFENDVLLGAGRQLVIFAQRMSSNLEDMENARGGLMLPTDDENLSFMQYTGLKDRTGKEIYEGDIVRNGGYTELCIINYHQGQFIGRYEPQTPEYKFRKDNKRDENLSYIGLGFYACERNSIEVIGNIYENPELLKEDVPASTGVSTGDR